MMCIWEGYIAPLFIYKRYHNIQASLYIHFLNQLQ